MNSTPSTPQPKKLIRFDWAIKTLLRNKQNFGVLEGFLSELLRTDVKIEELIESESNKRYPDDKSNRVDIAARLGNGEHVIIELQSAHQDDFISRMLYGVSKVVVDYLQAGDRYKEIPRIISVNIVYFDLGQGSDYIYHGTTEFKGLHQHDILQLNESEKKHYPDKVSNIFPEYYLLKVNAFNLRIRDTLDEWMYALKQSEVRPEFKAKGIQTAGEVLARLSLSQEELAAYELYIDNARNARSTILTAFSDGEIEGHARGLAEGREEGLAEGKRLMILNLHHAQMPLEHIAQIAEVSLEEVQKIISY